MSISLLDRLPARDHSQGEPRSFTSLDGSVHLYVDPDGFEFYIEAKADYDPKALTQAISQAEWWGLEAIPEDECEPELREDDSVRIYLTPIVSLAPRGEKPRQRTALQTFYRTSPVLAGGVALAGGVVVEYLSKMGQALDVLQAAGVA